MQHTYASTIAFAVGFASALCIISPIISSGLQSAVSDSDTMISVQRSSKRHGSCRVIDIHRHSCIIALRSDFHLKINESASDVRCVCINWWKLSHVRSCTSPSIVVAQWDSGTVEQRHTGTLAYWHQSRWCCSFPGTVMCPGLFWSINARQNDDEPCISSKSLYIVCMRVLQLRLLLTGIIKISLGAWFSWPMVILVEVTIRCMNASEVFQISAEMPCSLDFNIVSSSPTAWRAVLHPLDTLYCHQRI